MTAAYRLKGVGWLIAAVAIALGFYLVSLRVAEERKRLEAINARIVTAQRDIRAFETEFDTRANLVQLERWNGDTLALAAPTAAQFVHDAAQLASIDIAGAPLRTAALVVPSIAAPAATGGVSPAALLSTTLTPPSPLAASTPPQAVAAPLDPGARATLVKAAAVHAVPSPVASRALAGLANVGRDVQAAVRVRPQAIAMLDDKLLSDATLGDLLAKARREARGAR